ncbi:kinase-like domain-containing protein [Rhizophagus clarus]|uniref:Kinase-like domain-containing protein n=1 Tax=Rhizophagus clarus TaxID=94130 RepID=A0A8H3M7I1_9GLOM|nr:kinase-like domain-containing protein [Rhizophagus clarus]
MEEKPKNLWKDIDYYKYQVHATISIIDSRDADERIVYIKDLEKRKQVYGICGECNEPGTGNRWCQPCNAKRFKDDFKNWTSENKDIDEFIQQSQLNAVHHTKCLEWIPFEKFQNITYIAEGGYGRIYSAEWPEGYIKYWDIENLKWCRYQKYDKYALKSLNNSTNLSSDFLHEIKSHLQIYLFNVVRCFGITQNPNTKAYMMVLKYCLLDIHNAGKVHKDFHSGNILFFYSTPFISDLGMCQTVNKQSTEEVGICGVLPYMAPEVLCGHQYTQASDIYSFGIIMNEFLSEETPYNDISHDELLAVKICKGLRPEISKNIPKLLADLIMKCWDAEAKNRPSTKDLYQILKKWKDEIKDESTELYFQIKEYDKISKREFKKRLDKYSKTKNIQTHPQAIYTSRHLNLNNLPEPVNSSNLSFLDVNNNIQSTSANLISECFDVQLSELELDEIYHDEKDVIN